MSENQWLKIFGDNLVSMLKDANMTQKELAEAAELSESTISNYINKQKIPSVRSIVNIAYALDTTTDELIDFGQSIS